MSRPIVVTLCMLPSSESSSGLSSTIPTPIDSQEAPIRAAERADELLEAGNIDGVGIWRAVLAAIEELQLDRGPEDSVN